MTSALGLLNWTAAKKQTSRHMIAELLRRRVWQQYFSKPSYCPSILGAWGIVVLGNGNGCGGMPTTKQSIKDSLLQQCWKSALTKGLGFRTTDKLGILNEFLEWNTRDVQVFIWHMYSNLQQETSINHQSLIVYIRFASKLCQHQRSGPHSTWRHLKRNDLGALNFPPQNSSHHTWPGSSGWRFVKWIHTVVGCIDSSRTNNMVGWWNNIVQKRMIGWIENDSWLYQMRMMGYGWFIGIDGGEMFHEFWFGMVVYHVSSLGSGVRVGLELGIPVLR